MVKSLTGVTPKPRFGPNLDSTASTHEKSRCIYVRNIRYSNRISIYLHHIRGRFEVSFLHSPGRRRAASASPPTLPPYPGSPFSKMCDVCSLTSTSTSTSTATTTTSNNIRVTMIVIDSPGRRRAASASPPTLPPYPG